jgi:Ca2+/Na+ antiporter
MEILTSFVALLAGFVLLAFGANAVVSVCLQTLGGKGARVGLALGLALVTIGSIFPEASLILGAKRLEHLIENGQLYVPLVSGSLPEKVGLIENSTEPVDRTTEPALNKRAIDDPALDSLKKTLIGRVTTSIPVGLIFGSSLVNLLLVVGIAGLRFGRALPTSKSALTRDGVFLLAGLAYAGIVLAKIDVGITSLQLGGAGIAAALVYVLAAMTTGAPVAASSATAEGAAAPAQPRPPVLPSAIPGYLYFFGGLIALWQGSSLITNFIAQHMLWLHLNFSAGELDVFAPVALFGLAIGVAIPELVAASIIARRDEPDLALATVLTATVLNLLGGLGLAVVLFNGFPSYESTAGLIANPLLQFSVDWIVLLIAVAFALFFCLSGKELSTGESLMLILLFMAYVAIRLPMPVSEECGTIANCASEWLDGLSAAKTGAGAGGA